MTPLYDVDHFIRKFEQIPNSLWHHKGDFFDAENPERKCALGHCGWHRKAKRLSEEGQALERMFRMSSTFCVPIAAINDGKDPMYQQPTPKQRVLAALKDIKDRGK